MLSKKSSLILTTAVITLLAGASYPTLAADNSWIKNPQKTAAQEAADKAREDRLAEMRASIGIGAKQESAPAAAPAAAETKPEEAAKPAPSLIAPKASAEPEKQPTVKPHLSWREQIKLRRAERLKREQEKMEKEKAEEKSAEKPATLSHDQNRQGKTINEMIKKQAQEETTPSKKESEAERKQKAIEEFERKKAEAPQKSAEAEKALAEREKRQQELAEHAKQLEKAEKEKKPAENPAQQTPGETAEAKPEVKAGISSPPPPPSEEMMKKGTLKAPAFPPKKAPAATGAGGAEPKQPLSLLEQIRQGRQLKSVNEAGPQSPTINKMIKEQEQNK